MAADKIIAQPGTSTGSIGVVCARLNIGQDLKERGIDVDSVSVGKNAAVADEYTDLTPEQRRNTDHHIDQ